MATGGIYPSLHKLKEYCLRHWKRHRTEGLTLEMKAVGKTAGPPSALLNSYVWPPSSQKAGTHFVFLCDLYSVVT